MKIFDCLTFNDENSILEIKGDGSCRARNISLELESVGIVNSNTGTAPTMISHSADLDWVAPENPLSSNWRPWPGASFQLPLGWNDKDMITFKDDHGKFNLNSSNFLISCEANFLRPSSLSNISFLLRK